MQFAMKVWLESHSKVAHLGSMKPPLPCYAEGRTAGKQNEHVCVLPEMVFRVKGNSKAK